MVGIVLLAGQLGVVISGFIGMSAVVGWYHSDKSKGNKGGERNDKANRKLPNSNL